MTDQQFQARVDRMLSGLYLPDWAGSVRWKWARRLKDRREQALRQERDAAAARLTASPESDRAADLGVKAYFAPLSEQQRLY